MKAHIWQNMTNRCTWMCCYSFRHCQTSDWFHSIFKLVFFLFQTRAFCFTVLIIIITSVTHLVLGQFHDIASIIDFFFFFFFLQGFVSLLSVSLASHFTKFSNLFQFSLIFVWVCSKLSVPNSSWHSFGKWLLILRGIVLSLIYEDSHIELIGTAFIHPFFPTWLKAMLCHTRLHISLLHAPATKHLIHNVFVWHTDDLSEEFSPLPHKWGKYAEICTVCSIILKLLPIMHFMHYGCKLIFPHAADKSGVF